MLSIVRRAALAVLAAVSATCVLAQPASRPLDNMVRGYLAATPSSSQGHLDVPVVAAQSKRKAVHLPGVTVYLEEAQTGAASAPATTDLSGRFSLYAAAPGRQRLCWKSDAYGAGCTKDFIIAGRAPQFLSTVQIALPARRDLVALSGNVRMADSSSTRTFDPMLNINSFATVDLEDRRGKRLARVYVNNDGEYLLPYVPARQDVRVRVREEAGQGGQEISREARLFIAASHRVNLQLENHRPVLEPLVGVDAATNKAAQNAPVGGVIKLTAHARDKDGDPITYFWFAGEGHGTLAATTGASNDWQLPNTPGRYSVTVVAADGKGGYAKSTAWVLATGKGTPFTGNVITVTGTPIPGAEVEIVGDGVANPAVTSDAVGGIATNVNAASRYVVNVRKEGYALNSQVYDRGVTGGHWILRTAQVVTVTPTSDIRITHRRGERDCVGPDSVRASTGIAGASLTVAQWQDGKGEVLDSAQAQLSAHAVLVTGKASSQKMEVQRAAVLKRVAANEKQRALFPRELRIPKCGPGVSVFIPANSIIDEHGAVVTAPIKVAISTVDLLSSQQMPGDESVKALGGGSARMESYGAGALDLPKGMKLKPGTNAEVTIPVDRSRLTGGTRPATVPLLSYDEARGIWNEEGTLTLTTAGGVQSYVGNVAHFSSFNADTLFTSNACLRVFSPGLGGSYDLEVTAPNPDGSPHVKKYTMDNTSATEHVIYNLVPNENLALVPMTPAPNSQILGYYVVNAGPVTPFVGTPGAGNAPPGPGYVDCKNFVVFSVGRAPDSPFGGEFLGGIGFIDSANLGFQELTPAAPTGSALRDALVAASSNYYSTIDPTNAVDTFAKFKTTHGFDPNPAVPVAGEIVASYANSGDLGFGRDMHCLKKANSDVVCYVTNYGNGYTNTYDAAANGGPGTPDTDDANAAATRTTVGASSDVATVAMEYSDLPGAAGSKVVKFYVYKAALTTASGAYARSISANLDGRGERPVPQLCMICHGGQVPQQSGGVPTFGNNAQVTLGSRFLPFDHRFYTSPTAPTIAAQEPAFKSLNEQIVNSAPPAAANDPVKNVVAGLYNNGASATQIRNFTVPDWQTGAAPNVTGQSTFYQEVVADGCRTCHITQPFPQLQFNSAQNFLHLINSPAGGTSNYLLLGTAQNRVCGDYVMPHAFRTHEIFWGTYADIGHLNSPPSVSMPQRFQQFGDGIPAPSDHWSPNLCTAFLSTSIASPSVFYSQSIQPIFNGKCTACHVGAFKPFTIGVSLNTLTTLGLIAPGNDSVAANKLLQRTTAADPNNRMPPRCFRAPETAGQVVSGVTLDSIPCLSQIDLDLIKAWLRSGAN